MISPKKCIKGLDGNFGPQRYSETAIGYFFPEAANLEFQAIKTITALGWIAKADFYNPGWNVVHDEVTHFMTQLGEKIVSSWGLKRSFSLRGQPWQI
jgi:hypothetical protein